MTAFSLFCKFALSLICLTLLRTNVKGMVSPRGNGTESFHSPLVSPTVYVCFHDFVRVANLIPLLFPGQEATIPKKDSSPKIYDVMIFKVPPFLQKGGLLYYPDMIALCDNHARAKSQRNKTYHTTWRRDYDPSYYVNHPPPIALVPVIESFPGIVIALTAEQLVAPQALPPHMMFLGPQLRPLVYQLEERGGNNQVYKERVTLAGGRIFKMYYAQLCLLVPELFDKFLRLAEHGRTFTTQAELLQRKPQFLSYIQSDCRAHRDRAFDKLFEYKQRIQLESWDTEYYSNISISSRFHCGGACCGSHSSVKYGGRLKNQSRNGTWQSILKNSAHLSSRFGLAMENSLHHLSFIDAYITEKIVMAFFKDEIPIYQGPMEVKQLFNPEACIFYDAVNHTHLQKIYELETNVTKYVEMYRQPIFTKQGLRRFWSLRDDLFGGEVIKNLRSEIESMRNKRIRGIYK
mmetsp:Transcript_19972/g.33445  ORF Transcript_19972/g.33445 Transcript_19972/m.33445 type:complete len:461 (+) Transcript_19972:30-1412(+)